MTTPVDLADLLMPLLAAVIHPATVASAIILTFTARSRWTVRGATAAVAGAVSLIDAVAVPRILEAAFIVASSALGGLVVAEAVLVVLAPVLAVLFGLAAVILARIRTLR